MENLINNLNLVKECHDQYSAQDMFSLPPDQLKTLCIKEKINFIESLNKMDTKLVINERIAILQERNSNNIQKRREFLNSLLK